MLLMSELSELSEHYITWLPGKKDYLNQHNSNGMDVCVISLVYFCSKLYRTKKNSNANRS